MALAQGTRGDLGDVSLRKAVAQTLQTAGLDVVNNPHRFLAFVMDVAEEDSRELLTLIRNCDDELMAPFAQAASARTAEQVQRSYHVALQVLSDNRGIDARLARRISAQIALGLCDGLRLSEPRELLDALASDSANNQPLPMHDVRRNRPSRQTRRVDSATVEKEKRLREQERRLAERERALAQREARARSAQSGVGQSARYGAGVNGYPGSNGYMGVPNVGQGGGSQGMQMGGAVAQGPNVQARRRNPLGRIALVLAIIAAVMMGGVIGMRLLGQDSGEQTNYSSQVSYEKVRRFLPGETDSKDWYLTIYKITNNADESLDVTIGYTFQDADGNEIETDEQTKTEEVGVLGPGESKLVSGQCRSEDTAKATLSISAVPETTHATLKGPVSWEEDSRTSDAMVLRIKNEGDLTAHISRGVAYGTSSDNGAIYSPGSPDEGSALEIEPGEEATMTFKGGWKNVDYSYDVYLYGYME